MNSIYILSILYLFLILPISPQRKRKNSSTLSLRCESRNVLLIRARGSSGTNRLLVVNQESSGSEALVGKSYTSDNIPGQGSWKLCTYTRSGTGRVPQFISLQNRAITRPPNCTGSGCENKYVYIVKPMMMDEIGFETSSGPIPLKLSRASSDNRMLSIRSSRSYMRFRIGDNEENRWLTVTRPRDISFPVGTSGSVIRRFPVSLKGVLRGSPTLITSVFILEGNERYKVTFGQNDSAPRLERAGQGNQDKNMKLTFYKVYTLPHPDPDVSQVNFMYAIRLKQRNNRRNSLSVIEDLDSLAPDLSNVIFESEDDGEPQQFGDSNFYSVTQQLFFYTRMGNNKVKLKSAVFTEYTMGSLSKRQQGKKMVIAQIDKLSANQQSRFDSEMVIDNFPNEADIVFPNDVP